MAKHGPQKCLEPVVIILSDDEGSQSPKRQSAPIVISSDEEGSPPPKKPRVTENKDDRSGKKKTYGEARTEDFALAAKHQELMRSWVDIGIQLAITEMKGGDTSAKLGRPLELDFQSKTPHLSPDETLGLLQYPYTNTPQSRCVPGPHGCPIPPKQMVHGSYISPYIMPPPKPCGPQAYPIPNHHPGQYKPVPQAYSHPPNHPNHPRLPVGTQYLTHDTGELLSQSASRQPFMQTLNSIQNYSALPVGPPVLYNPHPSGKMLGQSTSPQLLSQNFDNYQIYSVPSVGPPVQTLLQYTGEMAGRSVYRQPLSQVSNNPQRLLNTTQEKSKIYTPFQTNFVLPPNKYLSFYELESRFCVPKESERGKASALKSIIRTQWLTALGINIAPYSTVWNAEYKKSEVEDEWAALSAEKRRVVEMHAVCYKYNTPYDATLLPLRPVPVERLPLTFSTLERNFFLDINIREHQLKDDKDFNMKRKDWLQSLNLLDPVYQTLATNGRETSAIDELYNKKTPYERRRIETKAKYLKVMLQPPNPLWSDFENTYCTYSHKSYSKSASYQEKRHQWLQSLAIDYEPFCWTASDTDLGRAMGERQEIAWDDLGVIKREEIIKKAIVIKESPIPLVSWAEVEDITGFLLEADFDSDVVKYIRHRKEWLKKIGMSDECLQGDDLQKIWIAKSFKEREDIFTKAQDERIKFDLGHQG